MITYKWKIESLRVNKKEGENANIVINAIWTCFGSDENKSAEVYGNTSFPTPDGDIINYNDLTEETVLNWIFENGVDKSEVENKISAEIEEQLNSETENKKLPWL